MLSTSQAFIPKPVTPARSNPPATLPACLPEPRCPPGKERHAEPRAQASANACQPLASSGPPGWVTVLQVPVKHSLFSEISRKPDPGESWPLFPSLHISHADLFYGEGSPLFLMVTIAIKQILNYVGVNHPAGGLKQPLSFSRRTSGGGGSSWQAGPAPRKGGCGER